MSRRSARMSARAGPVKPRGAIPGRKAKRGPRPGRKPKRLGPTDPPRKPPPEPPWKPPPPPKPPWKPPPPKPPPPMRALTALEAAIAPRKVRVASAIIVFRNMIRPPPPSLGSTLGHQEPPQYGRTQG